MGNGRRVFTANRHMERRSEKISEEKMKLAMTIREAADALSIGESTIRAMLRNGTFPTPFYVGDSPRFKVKDLEEWMSKPPPEKKKAGRTRLAISPTI